MGSSLKKNVIEVENLIFHYGERLALDRLSLKVGEGALYGIVGPNGGGKSTTFKLLSTLEKPESGTILIYGEDAVRFPHRVREKIGVVFQSPALDKKLTVFENLYYHGQLYGQSGAPLKQKIADLLKRFDLTDRTHSPAEKLSGGLKRRVEIAKSLLSDPKLLILDEPTTGLDPIARREVWNHLKELRKSLGMTILLTTHLLDEADTCDEVAFLDQGKVVVSGTPEDLKSAIGGDVISLRTKKPLELQKGIREKFQTEANVVDEEVRIQKSKGAEFIPALVLAFGSEIESVTLGKPTLEDLFIMKTGRRFWQAGGGVQS